MQWHRCLLWSFHGCYWLFLTSLFLVVFSLNVYYRVCGFDEQSLNQWMKKSNTDKKLRAERTQETEKTEKGDPCSSQSWSPSASVLLYSYFIPLLLDGKEMLLLPFPLLSPSHLETVQVNDRIESIFDSDSRLVNVSFLRLVNRHHKHYRWIREYLLARRRHKNKVKSKFRKHRIPCVPLIQWPEGSNLTSLLLHEEE